MIYYKVYDNVLPKESFNKIKDFLLGPWISWSYNTHAVKFENQDENLNNYQFTHTFYRNYSPSSEHISVVDPILQVLNPSAIIRIKANLTPRSDSISIHGFHIDVEKFKGKTAIFYVNTNDGYTIFEDGTKIDSVENRLLVFDSNILHSGTTCTDQKIRCVINFNYYEWDQ